MLKKTIDLNSLVSSYNNLPKNTFKKKINFLNISMRDEEVEQISSFIQKLEIENKYLGNFYVGYKIPQIDKEFDLLKFGENYILNIEIKSILEKDKAQRQLLKNKYYLELLGKKLKLFTYVYEDDTLYQLDDNEQFNPVDFTILKELLISQKLETYANLDSLFNPSNYLVSPFNQTDKFINGEFFLTKQQQEFKKEMFETSSQFIILKGLPGTGKTLLLYDYAKEIQKNKNIALIHTGELNKGHLKLIQQYKWNILPAKNYEEINVMNPEVIFIDESQRMYPRQLQYIIDYIEANDILGFFSIDPRQILSLREGNYRNLEKIEQLNNNSSFLLSKKIRTNKELGAFIKGLFNLNTMKYCKDFTNISLHYFDDIKQAKSFADGMEEDNWQVIDYTSQNYNGHAISEMQLNMGLNAHAVLGQEFDKVVVLVGPSFYYTDKKGLAVRNVNFYDPERMLYQSVTRARKQIMLLVVDNPEFMTNLIQEIKIDN